MDVEEEEKNKRLYYDKYPEDFSYHIYAHTRIVKAFKVNTETATNWSDVIAYCLGNGEQKTYDYYMTLENFLDKWKTFIYDRDIYRKWFKELVPELFSKLEKSIGKGQQEAQQTHVAAVAAPAPFAAAHVQQQQPSQETQEYLKKLHEDTLARIYQEPCHKHNQNHWLLLLLLMYPYNKHHKHNQNLWLLFLLLLPGHKELCLLIMLLDNLLLLMLLLMLLLLMLLKKQ